MAAQKNKPKKSKNDPSKSAKFNWSTKRKNAAFLLSLGTKNYNQIAEEVGIHRDTLFEWRQIPEFMEKVDTLILTNENFTRAGLLKNCLRGLDIKEHYISEDKNTYLDYIKEIAELQGYVKQKVDVKAEHSGQIVVNLVRKSFRKEDNV